MTNPHLLQPSAKRWNNPRFAGGKMYLAAFFPTGYRSRRIFKRASEAQTYAERVHARWCRAYDERIAAMENQPAVTPAEPA